MQFLLEDSAGSYRTHDGSELGVRTIIAHALERNSRLLALLAGASRAAAVTDLEPELLRQLAVWRLFLRSSQRTRARDACERLRQTQQQYEAAVAGLLEALELQGSLPAEHSDAAQALGVVTQRLERLLDGSRPRRDLEELLLVDADALRALAADALEPAQRLELEAVLAANLLQEARKAQRRCEQALKADGSADQRLRARRWLQQHLEQMELFAASLSEEARRSLWYRRRLLRMLKRLAGIAVLRVELEEALLTRQLAPREFQALVSLLSARRAACEPRAARLYRHGFPSHFEDAELAGASRLQPANADQLEDEPASRDIALL